MQIQTKTTKYVHNTYSEPKLYSATVFYFDNMSFLEHVLNQVSIPNESSISQAFYRTTVLTICFQPFYGGRVAEKMK